MNKFVIASTVLTLSVLAKAQVSYDTGLGSSINLSTGALELNTNLGTSVGGSGNISVSIPNVNHKDSNSDSDDVIDRNYSSGKTDGRKHTIMKDFKIEEDLYPELDSVVSGTKSIELTFALRDTTNDVYEVWLGHVSGDLLARVYFDMENHDGIVSGGIWFRGLLMRWANSETSASVRHALREGKHRVFINFVKTPKGEYYIKGMRLR